MILFFDTETTGLPKNWKAPVTDLNNWPRMVQLAYVFQDEKGQTISHGDYIVKPEGFIIPPEASLIHGITTERAVKEGKELNFVLDEFNSLLQKADFLVAHNISYDEKIVGAEFLREGMNNLIQTKETICTMESATDYCSIDGPYGYKWPKLSELYYKLFHENFEEAHNAVVDIKATVKCFWELKKKGIINLSNASFIEEDSNNDKSNKQTDESKQIKQELEDYCKENGYNEIPLTAYSEAIMNLEFKFKQLPTNININDEFTFLRDYWAKRDSDFQKQALNEYQKEFILSIKNEIINQHKEFSLFKDEKNKTNDDKISQLEVIAFASSNDTKKYRDLVIHIYYYYLVRYKKFLPPERQPLEQREEDDINYSNYSVVAQNAHKDFEKGITNYWSRLKKTKNWGIPEAIYDLVTDCSNALNILKSEVGIEDELYIKSASKIVKLSSNMISDWIKECGKVMHTPIQGMRLGNTLFEICNLTVLKIDNIEVDAETKKWFNNIKDSFDAVGNISKPKSGCYIATMAYGSYDHCQVIILRDFRDKYLLKTILGKYFVSFYYWISPKLVEMWKDNDSIKKLSRRLLNLIIEYFIPSRLK